MKRPFIFKRVDPNFVLALIATSAFVYFTFKILHEERMQGEAIKSQIIVKEPLDVSDKQYIMSLLRFFTLDKEKFIMTTQAYDIDWEIKQLTLAIDYLKNIQSSALTDEELASTNENIKSLQEKLYELTEEVSPIEPNFTLSLAKKNN